jgi:hypothetical protein
VVEPALVGVGVCAASVLVAVIVGLLLSRGLERLFRRGRRDSRSDEPDEPEAAAAEPNGPPGEPEAGPGEVPAETEDAPT